MKQQRCWCVSRYYYLTYKFVPSLLRVYKHMHVHSHYGSLWRLSACTSTSPFTLPECLCIAQAFLWDLSWGGQKENNLVQFATCMCIILQHSKKIAYIHIIYMSHFLEYIPPSNECCRRLLKEGVTYFHVSVYWLIAYGTCRCL